MACCACGYHLQKYDLTLSNQCTSDRFWYMTDVDQITLSRLRYECDACVAGYLTKHPTFRVKSPVKPAVLFALLTYCLFLGTMVNNLNLAAVQSTCQSRIPVRSPCDHRVNFMTTSPTELTPQRIRADLHSVLRQWAAARVTRCALDYLLLFQNALRQANGNLVKAVDQLLTDLLATLVTENEHYAYILRRRFADNMTAQSVANELELAESSFFNLQRPALERAAELLYEQEVAVRTARRLAMERLLEPPTYTALVGVDALLAQLLAQMMLPTDPWLFALEGMGGLGKTSLANALLRRLIVNPAPFVNIGWVTAAPISL